MNAEELLQQIFKCMTELLEVKEFSKTVKILTDLGRTLVDADRASFWFWDKDEKQYWTLAATGNVKITVKEGTGVVGKAIAFNEAFVCNDPYEKDFFNKEVDEATGYVTKSILCIPVTNSAGEVIGAFEAINKANDESFSTADIERLSLPVVYCEKTLESYLLLGDTSTDEVTGLRDKKAFLEYYNSKIANNIWKIDTCLILGEIDNIQAIRKSYGDTMTDSLIKRVGKILTDALSVDDLIAKWDEERFIIVLQNKNSYDAVKLANSMCSTIAERSFATDRGQGKLTISFGVQQMDGLFSLEENMRFAENNLAEAISSGGNKTV